MCEATCVLNREDRLFRGAFGKLLAQKWPRTESSRREEHLFLLCNSLSPSQSPLNCFICWFCKLRWSQGDPYSPGASNVFISYHSLVSPSILFFIRTNKWKTLLLLISWETYLTNVLSTKIVINVMSQPILTARQEHTGGGSPPRLTVTASFTSAQLGSWTNGPRK